MPGKTDRRGYLNIRFSDTARWIIDELQDHLGLSQASVIEMLLREEARRRGIVIPGSGMDPMAKSRHDQEADSISRQTAALTRESPGVPKKNHKDS